jgi:energy-coupling factor transporter transmembrane protein EcfT
MKRKIIIILSLIIIDIIIVKFWILYQEKPIPYDSLYGIFVSLYCFIANIFICVIMYFIKKKFAIVFVINAFICVFILAFVQFYINKNYMESVFEKWEFYIGKNKHKISYSTFKSLDSVYFTGEFDSIYDITVLKGSYNEDGLSSGTVHIKNDTVYFLSVDSCRYYIYEDTLYNFENIEKIKVKKIY